MTAFAIDAIVIVLFLLIVLTYTLKGLISSLVGFLKFWIASGVATLFSPTLGTVLQPILVEKIGFESDGSFFSEILGEVITSGYLAKTVAFILIFIGMMILIKIVEIVMNASAKLPLIRFFNRTFGFLLGIAIGFFWVELLAFGAVSIVEAFGDSLTFIPEGVFENTLVTRWLYEHNIFRWIIDRIVERVSA